MISSEDFDVFEGRLSILAVFACQDNACVAVLERTHQDEGKGFGVVLVCSAL